jgi:ribosome-interacting GTPase 1
LPANLTAEAKAKWQLAQISKNPKEKLQAYAEFLAEIPPHKGNERLRAQVKTKIAELKQEIITRRGRHGGGKSPWSVEREGAAQVMILGLTNTGKSSLLRSLTNAQATVASYEYTTQRPIPGILQFQDIQIQLVEVPAPRLARTGRYEFQPEAIDLIHHCDGLIVVVDLTSNPDRQLELITTTLEEADISIQKPLSRVEIILAKGSGEIRIATTSTQSSVLHEQIRELLHSYGVGNALVRIYGSASIDDVEDAVLENVTLYKPTLLIANKSDLYSTREVSSRFIENVPASLPTAITSCLTGQGVTAIGSKLFESLGIIRVYTKEPNDSKPSGHPFVVHAGTTVRELASSIHTSLAEKYRYSRIWGSSSKFAGERVGPEHVLGDQDIVEIHTT